MTLPIPFPIYGYTKDSNGDIIPNLNIVISGQTSLSIVSDDEGRYLANIQDITDEGQDVRLYAKYFGEHTIIPWDVSLTAPGKHIDVQLRDTITIGEKCLNGYHHVGNQSFLFTSHDTESYVKISDFDWDE